MSRMTALGTRNIITWLYLYIFDLGYTVLRSAVSKEEHRYRYIILDNIKGVVEEVQI